MIRHRLQSSSLLVCFVGFSLESALQHVRRMMSWTEVRWLAQTVNRITQFLPLVALSLCLGSVSCCNGLCIKRFIVSFQIQQKRQKQQQTITVLTPSDYCKEEKKQYRRSKQGGQCNINSQRVKLKERRLRLWKDDLNVKQKGCMQLLLCWRTKPPQPFGVILLTETWVIQRCVKHFYYRWNSNKNQHKKPTFC